MIRPLLTTLWSAALFTAVVLALVPARVTEHTPSQTRRRRATWLSWAFGIAGLPLLLGAVLSLPIGGPPNPLGMVAFVLLCVLGGVAWIVLRGVWGRVHDTERAERRAAGEHRTGEAWADPPPQPHRGLSGEEAPPTRW